MPQVFMVVGPKVLESVQPHLKSMGEALVAKTEEVYGLEGLEDVAFTAIGALCIIGDADIQIEIRYTAGEDEYDRGAIFEPSKEQQQELADALFEVLKAMVPDTIGSLSVWVIPYQGTIYEYR